MCTSEFRSVTCCVRSSGGAPGLDFGGLTTVLGMFFDNSGCFFGLGASGNSPKAGSTKCEKSVEGLGETCRLSPEDASGSEYLR